MNLPPVLIRRTAAGDEEKKQLSIPGIYFFTDFISQLRIPDVRWTDIVEVLIIAYLAYHILLWVKNTRAWQLMKGIAVVLVIALAAAFFNMTTILWIFQHFAGIAVTALVIILQPELRNAMEELGRKNFLRSVFRMEPGKTEEGRFSDRTINELVRACTEMGRAKTGALIVIEQTTPLTEYVRSGIEIDGIVSSQLLINIFEKNTPLHDGAAIVRGNRIVSATSYLPITSSRLDKNLGTRHRAGVGISEETDALTLIVSEETGHMSYSYKGQLWSTVTPEELRGALIRLQNKLSEEEAREARSAGWSPLSGIGKKALRRNRSDAAAGGAVPETDPFAADEPPAGTIAAGRDAAGQEGGAHE